MYDDDFDDYDGRNARRPRPPFWGRPGQMSMMRPRPSAPVYRPPATWAPAPWSPPAMAATEPARAPNPLMDASGRLKLGLILDAAAQVLASMATLPAAPSATEDAKSNAANVIAYQQALAQHAKRDEQIRTVGALARLFMV
jgi:hypothetical protein